MEQKGAAWGREALSWRFGSYTLDAGRGMLLSDGRPIPLRPKSFAVLRHLLENHHRLVPKQELLEAVWGHTYVTDGSLTQCIIDIRRALEDDDHELVRTVPSRGYVFEAEVTGPKAEKSQTRRERSSRRGLVLAGGISLGLMLALLLGAQYAGLTGWEVDSARPAPPDNTIAVLPFDDMSRHGDQEYFADGMAEELIDSLTHIENLRVTARTSAFSFKDGPADIPTIADKLDVAHVVEGSIRKAGDRVRVTVQLVDARSNTHLWSKTFDRDLNDIFAVQTEIARSVAQSLQLTLSERNVKSIAPPQDPKAYEHYLQGRYFWHRRGKGDVNRAFKHYRRAVEIDPGLARAWTGLAGVYVFKAGKTIDWSTAMEKRQQALERALEANPALAEAHARMSASYRYQGHEKLALKHWKKAKELAPNNWLILGYKALRAISRGDYRAAIKFQTKAARIDPLSALVRFNRGYILMTSGKYQEAEKEFRRAMELDPSSTESEQEKITFIRVLQGRHEEVVRRAEKWDKDHVRAKALAISYYALGQKEKAKKAMEEVKSKRGWYRPQRLAQIYAQRGDHDKAFHWLRTLGEKSYEEGFDPTTFIAGPYVLRREALLRPLRDDPRWEPLIARLSDQSAGN